MYKQILRGTLVAPALVPGASAGEAQVGSDHLKTWPVAFPTAMTPDIRP